MSSSVMDKNSIKAFIAEQKEKNNIVLTGKIKLSDMDRRLDSDKKTVSILIDNDDRFRSMLDKLKPVKKEEPVEKVVKAKVTAVSTCIRTMRRANPIETNIYCMTTKQLKARSVMTISSSSTECNYNTFGVFDKRLGCIEKKKTCITCFRKHGKCEGHEGFIPFPHPFINPIFQKDVIYALKSTCRYCGHVYANKDLIKAAGLHKLSGLNYKRALADISVSLHELHKHDTRIVEYYENNMKDHKVVYRRSNKDKADLYEKPIEDIKTIFDNYNENDLEILGYTAETKPSAFIMEGINTISPNLRLPGFVNGKLVNHYITSRYIDLIKAVNKLEANKDCDADALSQVLSEMYKKINEIFFGPENKGNSRTAEQDGGLMSTLTKKTGLLRGNGMGKRVNDSCRSVADPSVEGNTGEIGIPRSCAEFITVQENVHKYNKKIITEGIRNGHIKQIILIKNGEETKMDIPEHERRSFRIEIGDIIARPIRDGDIVMAGRQPSLHAASLMGFRVYLHDDEVVKISIENLAGFNLDFDGDEVTFHILQTIAAQVEAITTASSLYHVMNEQANRPMIGAAFHALLGGYLSTQTWNYVTYDEYDEDIFDEMTEELLNSDFEKTMELFGELRKIELDKMIQWYEEKIRNLQKDYNQSIKFKREHAKIDEKFHSDMFNLKKAYDEQVEQFNFKTQAIFEETELDELREHIKSEREHEQKRIDDHFMALKREVQIPEERWNQALSLINNSHRKRTLKERCERHGVKYMSGRALLSLPFPTSFTYKRDDIEIIDGILVKGVLKKPNIGTGEKSLIQVLFKLYSIREADRFINEILKVADWFVMWHGFSLGHHTFVTNRVEIHKKIYNMVNAIQARFYNLGPMPSDPKDLVIWKRKASGMMNKGQNLGKELGNSSLKKSNGLVILGSDGAVAKGSYMNTSQITGLLGCQMIKSDFQVAEFNNGTRRLVCFLPNDCSLESIGYILQSFYDGLKPSGLFYHMASSREGLVDTANNTSDIGYTHRRLEKGMEDTIVDARNMISSVSGKIFVFSYCGIAITHQVFVDSVKTGKVLSFCDFEGVARMVNRLYESMNERIA